MAPSTHPLQEGSFDPLATLRQLGVDAMEPQAIRLRVLWLRQREPAARIATALVSLDDRVVVISATIAVPDGGEGSGHAAARLDERSDLAEVIETTELRALGRALDNLGYVVIEHASSSSASDPDRSTPAPERVTGGTAPAPSREADRPVAVPQPEGTHRQPPEHVRALRSIREREQRTHQQAPADAPPASDQPRGQQEAQEPSQPVADRSRPRPIRSAPPSPAGDTGEPSLEDVSWTAFWEWARETYQLRSRGQLEELLGQPVGNKLPGELRRLLISHFDESGHDET